MINRTMKFVVLTSAGIDMGGEPRRVFKEGEVFDTSVVNDQWLRLLYDQHKIDLAPDQPSPVETPVSGTVGAPSSVNAPVRRKIFNETELQALSKKDLSELCGTQDLPTVGTKDELIKRLAALEEDV